MAIRTQAGSPDAYTTDIPWRSSARRLTSSPWGVGAFIGIARADDTRSHAEVLNDTRERLVNL